MKFFNFKLEKFGDLVERSGLFKDDTKKQSWDMSLNRKALIEDALFNKECFGTSMTPLSEIKVEQRLIEIVQNCKENEI